MPIENKKRNSAEFQQATRDFVCDDGSFFSVKVNEAGPRDLNYYSAYMLAHPDKFYIPELGAIREGGSLYVGDITQYQESIFGLSAGQIRANLHECKNADGKAVLDMYPERKGSSGE